MTQEAFKAWWYSEGSHPPYTHHDCEEHTMRMCEIAWANGAYKERETLAQTQEPVACVQDLDEVKRKHLVYEKGMDWKDPLYTTPPQPEKLDQDEVDIRSRLYQRIHELETQLAQPEQEPVAQCTESDSWNCKYCRKTESCKALQDPRNFASPPQRTWVGLTDEEIADCAEKMEASDPTDSFWREFFRGIEAKLKEKNT